MSAPHRLTPYTPLYVSQLSNIQAAKNEISKTKEQLAEEKKIALSIRIQPLKVDVSTTIWRN